MHGITACVASRHTWHHGVHGITACMAGSTLSWHCDPSMAHADDVPQLFLHGVTGHEQAPATHLWLSHPSTCIGPCVWALEVHTCGYGPVQPRRRGWDPATPTQHGNRHRKPLPPSCGQIQGRTGSTQGALARSALTTTPPAPGHTKQGAPTRHAVLSSI